MMQYDNIYGNVKVDGLPNLSMSAIYGSHIASFEFGWKVEQA